MRLADLDAVIALAGARKTIIDQADAAKAANYGVTIAPPFNDTDMVVVVVSAIDNEIAHRRGLVDQQLAQLGVEV